MLQGGAGGISIDSSLRFRADQDAFAAQQKVSAYVDSAPTSGGNGLLEDLQAAAPAIASRITVDTSAVTFQEEVLTED